MKLFFFICFLHLGNSVFAQAIIKTNVEKQAYSMTFENRDQDFGKVKKGTIKTTTFKFKNTGTEDIKIELVSGCECTTLDWPRRIIKPGEEGKIDAIFDSGKKEESETVDIDVNLENIDPKTGANRFEILTYKYELIK